LPPPALLRQRVLAVVDDFDELAELRRNEVVEGDRGARRSGFEELRLLACVDEAHRLQARIVIKRVEHLPEAGEIHGVAAEEVVHRARLGRGDRRGHESSVKLRGTDQAATTARASFASFSAAR
jgi:hypothetical protein